MRGAGCWTGFEGFAGAIFSNTTSNASITTTTTATTTTTTKSNIKTSVPQLIRPKREQNEREVQEKVNVQFGLNVYKSILYGKVCSKVTFAANHCSSLKFAPRLRFIAPTLLHIRVQTQICLKRFAGILQQFSCFVVSYKLQSNVSPSSVTRVVLPPTFKSFQQELVYFTPIPLHPAKVAP